MQIWFPQAPNNIDTLADRSQLAFGIPLDEEAAIPYDYSATVLRLRMYLGDVPLQGTSKLIVSENL